MTCPCPPREQEASVSLLDHLPGVLKKLSYSYVLLVCFLNFEVKEPPASQSCGSNLLG